MKNKATKKRPNLMQFTLSEFSQKILEQFAAKYGSSKSYVIDKALILLASQYHRKIVIEFNMLTDEFTTTTAVKKEYIPDTKPLKNNHCSNNNEEVISDEEIERIIENIETRKRKLGYN